MEATAIQPENISEALWWVIRYVSGSLTDEDWDWGKPTKLDINSAMALASRYIGNRKSINRPLSRYLLLDKNTAQKLVKSKMLPPYEHSFQSFTTHGFKEAVEIGRDIAFGRTKGKVEVVVTITPPANEVLFGYDDVAASRKPGVADLHYQWADNWGHQGEVLVRITQPMPCEVKVLKRGELDEAAKSSFERSIEAGALPATPENIAAAKAFVLKKWQERAIERGGPNATLPDDLSSSCKFSSLFARAVFGGKLEGNFDHQFVRAKDGTIIDLNIDAADVKELGDQAHRHDILFWGSRDHRDSVRSCVPRVKEWVAEFLADYPAKSEI